MFTLKAIGIFEGYEEAKTHPGKYYLYIKPAVKTPQGILTTTNLSHDFGSPVPGTDKLGTLAVLCDESQLPQFGFGQKVALSAQCWNICGGFWSKPKSCAANRRESQPLFILEGEIKASNARPVPFMVEFSGYLRSFTKAKNIPGKLAIKITPEEPTPEEYLAEESVSRSGNRGTVKIKQISGDVEIRTAFSNMQPMPINTLVRGQAEYWPVCKPYYSKPDQEVKHRVIPDPVFELVGSFNMDKATAKASA